MTKRYTESNGLFALNVAMLVSVLLVLAFAVMGAGWWVAAVADGTARRPSWLGIASGFGVVSLLSMVVLGCQMIASSHYRPRRRPSR